MSPKSAESAPGKRAPGKLPTGKPAAGKPAADKPAAGKPAAGKPAAGKHPTGRASGGPAPRTGARPERTRKSQDAGITVAVTGPTGAIGTSVIRALEADDRVDRILGMARRPFDPAALGLRKTEYRQGDVVDRDAVAKFVADADAVVHLAFAIMGGREQSRKINLEGTRNVFEATVAADRPQRLVYTSSLAAYGYYGENPVPLTEDIPARGSPEHYYSAQKAECEALLAKVTAGRGMEVYVLRPCIVVGPDSTLVISNLRFEPVLERLPAPARKLLGWVPGLHPVLPDPGVHMQLVHEADVAAAVFAAAVGAGPPGAYNLAGDGTVTMTDVARAMGDYAVPVPHAFVGIASRVVSALRWLPPEAEWINIARHPMLMDTTRARCNLGWAPQYTTREALNSMARAASR
jgi:UDP-glucose 4-epimerase